MNSCKMCEKKVKREKYVLKRESPEKFCLKCGLLFGGILKAEKCKDNPNLCIECCKKL